MWSLENSDHPDASKVYKELQQRTIMAMANDPLEITDGPFGRAGYLKNMNQRREFFINFADTPANKKTAENLKKSRPKPQWGDNYRRIMQMSGIIGAEQIADSLRKKVDTIKESFDKEISKGNSEVTDD
jgi:hypothetical protein